MDSAVHFHNIIVRAIVRQWEKLLSRDSEEKSRVNVHANWYECSCIYISRVLRRVEVGSFDISAEKLVEVYESISAHLDSESKFHKAFKTVREAKGPGADSVRRSMQKLGKTLHRFKLFIEREHADEDAVDRLPRDKAKSTIRDALTNKTMFRR